MCLTGIERRSPGSSPRVKGGASLGRPRARPGGRRSAGPRSAAARPGSSPPRRAPGSRCRCRAPGRPRRRTGDRLHRRREAGDRAGAQVVAVGEAAGDDDRVDAGEVGLLVPDQPRLADQRAGVQRVPLVAGAGELDDPEARHASLRSRSPRSAGWRELLAELGELRRVLGLELDHAADAHVLDALEAERRQRPLDRLALGVEDPLLRADQDRAAFTPASNGLAR